MKPRETKIEALSAPMRTFRVRNNDDEIVNAARRHNFPEGVGASRNSIA